MINNIKSVKMTADQAGEYLGVSTNLLGVWRHRKVHLEYLKIGKKILYELETLENFKKSFKNEVGA